MNYATIKKNDIANGVGVRVSIFVSGCRHKCKNCFNAEAWDFNYGKPFTDEVKGDIMRLLDHDYVSGLSILGGEPFEPENQAAVLDLAKEFKSRFPSKDIWCYTGFDFEDIYGGKVGDKNIAKELLENIDVLVDGRFIEEQKDPSLLFRGSANQSIIDVGKSLKEGKKVLLEGVWKRSMGSGNIYEV